MHRLFAVTLACFLSASAHAGSEMYDFAPKIDKLFGALHGQLDETTSKLVEMQIWALWASESSPEAVKQLADATAALNLGQLSVAEEGLNSLIASKPDFAEAWNRRATLYYMQGRYAESLADIEHVLALEPRHFAHFLARAWCYVPWASPLLPSAR